MSEPKITVELEGVEELRQTIKDMKAAFIVRVLALVDSIAEKVMLEAKTLAPVDTGMLRDSIKKELVKKYRVGRVFAGAPHAHLLEFGHLTKSGTMTEAHPFLVPALEKHRREFEDGMMKIVKDLSIG